MSTLYLLALATAIACMSLIDWRFKLFFWRHPRAAAFVTLIGVGVMLAWDIAGIALGIFIRGEGEIATGILIAPELPIEEPIFLFFLVQCTMVIYTGVSTVLERRKTSAGS